MIENIVTMLPLYTEKKNSGYFNSIIPYETFYEDPNKINNNLGPLPMQEFTGSISDRELGRINSKLLLGQTPNPMSNLNQFTGSIANQDLNQLNTGNITNTIQQKNPSQSILDYFSDKIGGLLETKYMGQPVANVTTYDVDGTTATQVDRIPDSDLPKTDNKLDTAGDEVGGLLGNLEGIGTLVDLFSKLTTSNTEIPPFNYNVTGTQIPQPINPYKREEE